MNITLTLSEIPDEYAAIWDELSNEGQIELLRKWMEAGKIFSVKLSDISK